MCYRVKRPSEEILNQYINGPKFSEEYRWQASYTVTGDYPVLGDANGFAHPHLPVIQNVDPHVVGYSKWGFLPGKVKDEEEIKMLYKKYYHGLNCNGNEAFDGRLYKKAIISQRCIILVPNFYESYHEEPGKTKTEKFPFQIEQKGKTMNALAGIWNDCFIQQTGEVRRTLAIVTTYANEAMQLVHNSKKRMPAYVRPEHFGLWLNDKDLTKEEVDQVIMPIASNTMAFSSLDKSFNAAKKGANEPINPGDYAQLSELMKQLQQLEM